MRARACVAAALAVLAAPIALAECDLARRLARNTPDADLAEAACDADLSRERIGALREATYPATPAPNPAAAPAKP